MYNSLWLWVSARSASRPSKAHRGWPAWPGWGRTVLSFVFVPYRWKTTKFKPPLQVNDNRVLKHRPVTRLPPETSFSKSFSMEIFWTLLSQSQSYLSPNFLVILPGLTSSVRLCGVEGCPAQQSEEEEPWLEVERRAVYVFTMKKLLRSDASTHSFWRLICISVLLQTTTSLQSSHPEF